MKRRGKFIVIEGIDGAGTTTQAARAAEHLSGIGVAAHLTREPSSGPIGALIRQVLSGRLVSAGRRPFDRSALALLFAADRLDHLASEIVPMLESGVSVVSDRYVTSSLAYQSLDSPRDWVAAINSLSVKPDLMVFLRVPAETAMSRVTGNRRSLDIFENLPLQRKVAAGYDRAVSREGKSRVLAVDGTLPVEEIATVIAKRLDRLFGASEKAPGKGI